MPTLPQNHRRVDAPIATTPTNTQNAVDPTVAGADELQSNASTPAAPMNIPKSTTASATRHQLTRARLALFSSWMEGLFFVALILCIFSRWRNQGTQPYFNTAANNAATTTALVGSPDDWMILSIILVVLAMELSLIRHALNTEN